MTGAADRLYDHREALTYIPAWVALAPRAASVLRWLADLDGPMAFGILAPPGGGKSVFLSALAQIDPTKPDNSEAADSDREWDWRPNPRHRWTAAELSRQAGCSQAEGHGHRSPEIRLALAIAGHLKGKGVESNGTAVALIDEADKGTAEEVGRFWLTLARLLRMLRCHPGYNPGDADPTALPSDLWAALSSLRVVLAYDEARLLALLGAFFANEFMAKELLSEVVCQVYFVAFGSAARQASIQTLRGEVGSGLREDGNSTPERRFLRSLEEQLVGSNLRDSRQAIAILNKVLGVGFVKSLLGRLKRKDASAPMPWDKLTPLVWPSLSLLALARDRLGPVYQEWTAEGGDLEPLVFFFGRMEDRFAARAVADIPDRRPLAQALRYIRSLGFRETADAVEGEAAPLLWWYREARLQVLEAWNAASTDSQGEGEAVASPEQGTSRWVHKQLDLTFLFTNDDRVGLKLTGEKVRPKDVAVRLWEEWMNA